jgi:hypothetical protein
MCVEHFDNCRYGRPSSNSDEPTPAQNFLEVLTEASAPQKIEMALKPRNDPK